MSDTTSHAASFHELQVQGAFAPTARARIFPCPGARKVLVNLHGSYGNMLGASGKYQRLGEQLQASGKTHAVLLESSRHSGDFSHLPDPLHRKVAPFNGKVFDQELEDFRRLFAELQARSVQLFGAESDHIDWALNGNSLGGLICLFLAAEFNGIRLLSTVSSGLRLHATGVEGNRLAMTMPHPDTLQSLAAFYRGRSIVSWGSQDSIFTREDCLRLDESLISASHRETHLFPGVNHAFDKIDGKESPIPYQQMGDILLSRF